MIAALFAFNWRTALISTVAVLVSVAAVVTVIYLRGAAINMMVIAGVMIALVAVIDDAIIDVENIVRRLSQHGREGDDIPVARIALAASMEMRRPILYATLVMVLVVIPVFFLQGTSHAFLEPLVSSYILALLASFLVALTVTPSLRRRNSCLKHSRSAAVPSGSQHPRGCPGSRWLQQTNR